MLAFNTVFATAAVVRPIGASTMTAANDEQTDASADELRNALTDRLRAQNIIRTSTVEEAIRRTARHLFLPGVPPADAYADRPVYTKRDGGGASISAASQPWIVATMLEQLAAEPGHRVKEVGAGTGYNAALIAAIVGPTGRVVTIDIDADLVDSARKHLAAAGVDHVEVILGDGAFGHRAGGPYDRIIATVGAYEIPTPWFDQLATGGRLVVPLRLRGGSSRVIAFERRDDRWASVDSQLGVFMPMRGIGDDARRIVNLTPEQDITLQTYEDQTVDAAALAGVLDSTPHQVWTGVVLSGDVSYEWMELWLCLRLDNALMRMNVSPDAAARGQVAPMFAWGSMAATRGADLMYLTTRPASSDPDGLKLYEVGVIAHGPTSDSLAHQTNDEIQTWNGDYRTRNVRFELPDTAESADPTTGRFVLDRPHHPITVIW
jgi:protein-L-isoaspartate(D-aspartate) O-methyltransferase